MIDLVISCLWLKLQKHNFNALGGVTDFIKDNTHQKHAMEFSSSFFLDIHLFFAYMF